MTTLIVKAVYRQGALQPERKLDLPENTLVQVQITPLSEQAAQGSLFGAFPELCQVADDDFVWVKNLWEHGVEKQSRILNGQE